MEKYKDMTIVKKSNVKMFRNMVLFVLLIIFTFWFIFKDQDINELITTIKNVNIKYLLLGALLMLGVYLTESINVRAILHSLGEKHFSIIRALKYTSIGAFFSAITPAATGGQPVEIYYMSKDGIKAANGTMAMLLQLTGFQVSTLTYSIIGGILNPSILSDGIIWFYILGLVINGFALSIMLLGTFSNKVSHKLLNFTIKMMRKAKVRNCDKKIKKLEEGLEQYTESAKFIKEHKLEFVKAMIRSFIQMFLYHSIPFVIYKACGLNELNFLQLFTMQSILYTTVSGIPLPGSIGVSESLFLKIFGIAFTANMLSGAMLLYRFVSFYLYIIIFLFIVIYCVVMTKNVTSEIDKNIIEIDGVFKDKKKRKISYSI